MSNRILKPVLVLLILLISQTFADEFIIKSFTRAPMDISARSNAVRDVNGNICALIKVRTDITNHIQFNSSSLSGDVKMENPGEYWVYVSPGARRLKLMADGFIAKYVPLEGAGQIESRVVYELIVTSKDILDNNIEKDLFSLTFHLNVEDVYIKNGNKAPIKTSSLYPGFELQRGIYSFTFSKEGYKTFIDTVHLNRSEQREIVLEKGYSDYKAGIPGIISIQSEPSGAEIYLNDQYVGVTPYQGNLSEGDYQLRLSKEFYHDHELNFNIKPTLRKEIPLVKLKSNYGFLTVETEPSFSDVYVNGTNIGKTPIKNYKIRNGIYNLEIVKDLYKKIESQITIENLKENVLKRNLEPTFGTFTITCKNVDSAQVFLNKTFIGLTPLTYDTLRYGKYDLTVRKDYYKDWEEKIEISGSLTERDIVLLQNYGTINITAKECKIYINDVFIGENQINKRYLPGAYIVKAVKNEKYYPVEEEIYLRNGEIIKKDYEPKIITGSISLINKPIESNGASVYVDGELMEGVKVPIVLELPIGIHTIEIKHPRFLDKVLNDIVIKENDYYSLPFTMVTYEGSLKQKENLWKIQKWAALGGTVVFGGLAYGANYLGDRTWEDYNAALNSADAQRLRDLTNLSYLGCDVSIGISVSSLLYAGFSYIQELRFKEYQKPGISFLEKIFGDYKSEK